MSSNLPPTTPAGRVHRPPGLSPVSRLIQGLLEAATGITPELKARFDDETICRRCGQCCMSATRVRDRMVMIKDLPCRYLQTQPDGTTACSIYSARNLTGWCHRVNVESIRKELFPPDCPYVQDLRFYQGKIELAGEEWEQIKPILRSIFQVLDRPEYVRKRDWDKFIHQTLDLPRTSGPASPTPGTVSRAAPDSAKE